MLVLMKAINYGFSLMTIIILLMMKELRYLLQKPKDLIILVRVL